MGIAPLGVGDVEVEVVLDVIAIIAAMIYVISVIIVIIVSAIDHYFQPYYSRFSYCQSRCRYY